jgi:hypothetical protein
MLTVNGQAGIIGIHVENSLPVKTVDSPEV